MKDQLKIKARQLSKDSSSTIGKEKQTNWSLQDSTEEDFVHNLLADQPFVPHYFPFDVELNRKGAPAMNESLASIKVGKTINKETNNVLDKTIWIIDTRKEYKFKEGHLPHSINLMEDGKFETWLGSIIKPGEPFYLATENNDQLQRMLLRTATIGYECQIKSGFVVDDASIKVDKIDVTEFKQQVENYTIVDIRNTSEVKEGKIFESAITIPLAELRNRVNEIPTNKPIVVHCAGGYRSAAGSSLIEAELKAATIVFDLGEAVKQFETSGVMH